METENVLNVVWSIVNSPVGITVIASIVLWLLNKVYASKPLWQQYEGVIISGIKFAEKNIPDDYPEKKHCPYGRGTEICPQNL